MEENAVRSQIQNKLQQSLTSRHTKEELVQLHILRDDSIAPSLQGALHNFQKAKMEDLLNRKLSNRPSREKLAEMGVLKDANLAPSLFSSKLGLEKAELARFLGKKLANRPTAQELEDKNVLHSTEWAQETEEKREKIGQNLEKMLAGKYADRFSSGQKGEAIPLINWAEDLISQYVTSEVEKAEQAEKAENAENPEQPCTPTSPDEPFELSAPKHHRHHHPVKTAMKKPSELNRELSIQSIEHKNLFIRDLVLKGRFACRNCCSEFFEGPEMASPRYSYHNFFDEEDWKDLPLKEPFHHEEAKKLDLCNMCFGVCSCGSEVAEPICTNCGSMRSITKNQDWRAPEYPRPRTVEEWQELRREQLSHYAKNYNALPREKDYAVKFSEEVTVEYFERYRFRNTLTDEGIFMEENETFPSGVLFSIEGEETQFYEVENETDGFYFLKPDSAGNLFVVGVSDEDHAAKNSTRVYLHDPAKNWFYYGDSTAGKIFCWDPATDSVRPVGA